MNFYKYHGEEGHMINQCEGFCNKVIQMMIQGILQIERGMDREVSMMDAFYKNKEVYRRQFTAYKLPKLILYKPTVAHKGNYSAIPYNYRYSFQRAHLTPVFQAEVRGLTHSGRCFTLKKLEKQKAKGKEMVDLMEEINKPVTEEETNEFLKLMK